LLLLFFPCLFVNNGTKEIDSRAGPDHPYCGRKQLL